MENTSLFEKQHKNECFTGIELLRLLCQYSGVQWDIKHMPKAMKLYTSKGIYTIQAGGGISFQPN